MEPTPRILGFLLLLCWLVTYAAAWLSADKMTLFIAWMFFLFGSAAMIRIRANTDKLHNKRIFVTDAHSVVGAALVEFLLQAYALVFAAARDPEDPRGCLPALRLRFPKNLHVVKMDVTSQTDVVEAMCYVCENLGEKHLHAVINTCSVQHNSETEMQTFHNYEEMFKVNYFGAIRIARVFLPLLRENSKKGRLINVSSVHARIGTPFYAGFSDSMAAMEMFCDGLRRELSRFELKVILLELGHFEKRESPPSGDQLWDRMHSNSKEVYGKEYADASTAAISEELEQTENNLQPVLEAFNDALAADNPKDRYLVSSSADSPFDFFKICALLNGFLPASLMDLFIELVYLKALPLPSLVQKIGAQKKM